jgi:hypothetical protein
MFVELLFYPANEIGIEHGHNPFMLEWTACCWPDPRMQGCDGVRILLVRGESATTVSSLALGGMDIPEN